MTIIGKEKANHSNPDTLEMERMPVPDSSALQQRILRITEHLPQYVGESGLADVYHGEKRFIAARKSFRSRLPLFPAAAAAGLVAIVLSVTSWKPFTIAGSDEMASAGTSPVMDELVLQEVILMSEEIAFATL